MDKLGGNVDVSGVMKHELAMVEKQLSQYNARNIDEFCSCYHADVTVEWILSKKVVSRGLSEFRERYHQLFFSSPSLHCEIRSRSILSQAIVDEEFVTGIVGLSEGLHTVVIYGFKDGLIERVWFVR